MIRRVAIGNRSMRVAMRSCLVVLSLAMLTSPTIADETEKEAVAPPPGALEFVGRNLLAKAKGVFHEWRIVESIVDPDSIEEAYAIVEVSLDSVDTGIGRRDRHLRDPDFFETETYPVAIVRVHSPTPIEDESGEAPRFSVRFDIDLHGVKKTLDGEVRLVGTSPVVFEGGLTIDRTEFGVGPKPNRWNPMSPKAEIPVEFRVEL